MGIEETFAFALVLQYKAYLLIKNKLAPTCYPIRSKTKPNRDSLVPISPRIVAGYTRQMVLYFKTMSIDCPL